MEIYIVDGSLFRRSGENMSNQIRTVNPFYAPMAKIAESKENGIQSAHLGLFTSEYFEVLIDDSDSQ
jgi:hypothetical protein